VVVAAASRRRAASAPPLLPAPRPPRIPALHVMLATRPPARTLALRPRAAQSVTGKVVSTAADKTVIVEVQRFPPHALYAKRIRQTKRYQAHDAEGAVGLGDTVRLAPCPPMSKTKRFAVAEVLIKGD